MKRILLIAGFWCIVLQAQAMTQAEFVQSLKNNHPFFNQQALSSQIKQVEMQATRANEDWLLNVSTAYNKDQKDSVSFSANKAFTDNGSRATLSHTWVDTDIADGKSKFSLDYVYPLLRNNGGINDRLELDVSQVLVVQNNLSRSEQEENFILKKLKRFVDLNYAQEQQLIHEHRLAFAKQELVLVQKKFIASVVDKVDVLLQEDAYQKAKQQLLQAQQDLVVLRHEIAITLGIDFDQITNTKNLYRPYKLNDQYNKKQLLGKARVLKITDLDLKILKRQLASFKNESQAQLDLNLGLVSEGDDTSYSNA